MSEVIREKVVDLRKKMGYNQNDIARLLDMNRNTYAYQEKNTSFSPETLVKLANILEVTPNDILLPKKNEPLFVPIEQQQPILRTPNEDLGKRLDSNFSTDETNLVKTFRMLRKKQQIEVLEYVNKLYHEK